MSDNSSRPRGPYRGGRADFRARSHDSAHEAASLADHPAPQPHVPHAAPGPADLITTSDQLAELIDHLRLARSFAYDSEFIGERTYIPQLCLVQVASTTRVSLVDPLCRLDLRPFWELVADPAVEKIVHAGQQDLEPLVRDLGRLPANVFDTQICAGFIGLNYPLALSKLAHELLRVRMGKALTFSHWDQRPLSPVQLRYAADDVRYLPAMRLQIGARLDALAHTPWAAEECAGLCDAALYRSDPQQQYLRVRGATSLPPRGLSVLRQLVVWRDAGARAADAPPRSFLKDEILIDLARHPVADVAQLARVKGLPRPVEQAHGQAIIDAVARGLAEPNDRRPLAPQVEESPAEKFRIDALWAAARCLAFAHSIDPDLLTNRHEMTLFYRHVVHGQPADDIRLLHGWRRHAVGRQLTDMVRAGAPLNVIWADGALRPAPSAV